MIVIMQHKKQEGDVADFVNDDIYIIGV